MVIKLKKYKYIILNIAISLGIGIAIALCTMNSMNLYQKINRPKIAPPGFIFPIVWSVLGKSPWDAEKIYFFDLG